MRILFHTLWILAKTPKSMLGGAGEKRGEVNLRAQWEIHLEKRSLEVGTEWVPWNAYTISWEGV